jgi:hypothetical protein
MSEGRHPVLYGAVGLDRQGVGSGGMGFVGTGRGARAVLLSESLSFDGPGGGTVTVTSHRPGDDDQFERARTWAPTGPYLASPRGKALAPRDGARPTPRPVEVEWAPATVLVDGEAAPFEMSDLGDGYWAAIGHLADAIVTIDSRGVPLSAVQLERLASRRPPHQPHRTSASGPRRSSKLWTSVLPGSPLGGSTALPTTGCSAPSRSSTPAASPARRGSRSHSPPHWKGTGSAESTPRSATSSTSCTSDRSKRVTAPGPLGGFARSSWPNYGSTRSGREPGPGSVTVTRSSAATPSVFVGDHDEPNPSGPTYARSGSRPGLVVRARSRLIGAAPSYLGFLEFALSRTF